MESPIDGTIAAALERFLAAQLQERPASRAFFRLSGFSAASYAALLDAFAARGWRLAERPLEVRSIVPIDGHAARVIAPGTAATWYRNSVPPDTALVLIQNRQSSDAQSLQDLFEVTEGSLSREGFAQLADACFTRFQLDTDGRAALAACMRRLSRVRIEPQLRDLVALLIAMDESLHTRPGTSIAAAMAEALPYIGLFRCRELENQLDSQRGEKLLRQLRDAARMGSMVLDERNRGDYLRRLPEARLDDDGFAGGLTAERKRDLLRKFIEGELRDNYAAQLEVFGIDWREVQLVINLRTRKSRQERLESAARQLLAALPGMAEEQDDQVDELIAELQAGREPDGDLVDRALAQQGELLPRQLRNELRRLAKPRVRKHGDFLVGLAAVAVELLQQDQLAPGTRLQVTPRLDAVSNTRQLPDALACFQALYGGCAQVIASVEWQLDPIAAQLAARGLSEPEVEAEDERERVVRVELPFRVLALGPDNAELGRAELIWQYRSDSPAAATVQTLDAEAALLEPADLGPLFGTQARRLRVPIFNSCPPNEAIAGLDLRRPLQSLGAWFEQPADLRATLLAQTQRYASKACLAALEQALDGLEQAWAAFVAEARSAGLLAANSEALLDAYEALLDTATTQVRSDQDARAFQVLSQAWIIGPRQFERWAVMPLLHPLKLLWWRERARFFDRLVNQLLDPAAQAQIVDEPRFRRELAATYGSSGFPPVLGLPTGEGRLAARFLPVEEADGFELFFREQVSEEAFGLDTELLADDEAAIAAQRAVEGITAVVQDYIETYPFVRDGLEIVLYDCRNSALPGLLAASLLELGQKRDWRLRLTVIAHTLDRGAALFQPVSAWVQAAHPAAEQRGGGYFPPVSLKVLQCSHDELLRTRDDTDIVILADVLATRGQVVSSELVMSEEPDLPRAGYLPTYQARQEPFQEGDRYRRLLLSHPQQPRLARLFLLAQHGAIARKALDAAATARFYRELTLDQWERELGELHAHFNWVVCYDPTIDRFLLRTSFPGEVQVIRYSLGLGAKRQHNLTVSASPKAQALVVRRLAARLGTLLYRANEQFLTQVAERLVAQAEQVSGDIVLRAAGPGAFLNELIGLVAAKFETERRFRARYADALTTWILLDDFEHWFGGGKFPDLLFVAVIRDAGGELLLHMEVLEAKCVGQLSFEVEAADAQLQVLKGVSRLVQAFAPGALHLDALFWYDQLYRAVIGSLHVELEQQPLWELFRERLPLGRFRLDLSGHTWAFCYDDQVDITEEPAGAPFLRQADGAPELVLRAHHYGRNELGRTLRALIEAGGAAPGPADMWITEPPPAPELLALAPVVDPPSIAVKPLPMPSPPEPARVEPVASPVQLAAPAPADEEAQWLQAKARELEQALRRRGVQVQRIDPRDADVGPSIVRFKLRLSGNETLKKLQAAAIDLARDLSLIRTPFIDNVLGTNYVGVDLPRERPETIDLLPLLQSLGQPQSGDLPIIIGKTPDGRMHVDNLAEFPHVLVAGATGSGKSVFLRSVLLGLMTQYAPRQVELLVVDPKQTDFSFFDGLPYLRGGKVFTDAAEAREALLELVRSEMPRRQQIMRGRSMKLKDFNQRFPAEALPPIVAMIDEYAQLLSIMNKKDGEQFERDLMSLAAVARATSIHLVLATQRPSVDVVTGTLKANLPTRIAFQVPTNNDSRVVLDAPGAENLLGKGDMLFRKPSGEIIRLQAPFLDEEAMQAYLAGLRRAE